MEIGQIIRNSRKAKGLTLDELAHQIDTDAGNLSRLERGKQGASHELLQRIMKALDLTVLSNDAATSYTGSRQDLLAEGSNVDPARPPYGRERKYPLISWVQAGEVAEAPSKIGEAHPLIESTENAGFEGYWLTVSGHSMTCNGNPSFPEGSLILVKPEAEIINGKYYVVEMLDSGEKTFKQYVEDAGYRYLRPLNDKYRTLEIDNNCRFIGRVVDTKMTGL
ncbi:LexA family protein [Pseudomonas caricapapayae]|uniref:LexA family protein n=1 Tax=Pseudomonas caricapapayae TaxID=46678 RepID=UPI000EFDBBD4|nr:XRE family transcriptional regulator [Pseudomonas caricapapayae]